MVAIFEVGVNENLKENVERARRRIHNIMSDSSSSSSSSSSSPSSSSADEGSLEDVFGSDQRDDNENSNNRSSLADGLDAINKKQDADNYHMASVRDISFFGGKSDDDDSSSSSSDDDDEDDDEFDSAPPKPKSKRSRPDFGKMTQQSAYFGNMTLTEGSDEDSSSSDSNSKKSGSSSSTSAQELPSSFRHKRNLLLFIAIATAIICITIGLVVIFLVLPGDEDPVEKASDGDGVGLGGVSTEGEGTNGGTPGDDNNGDERDSGIVYVRDLILSKEINDLDVWTDMSSPQYQALQWLVEEDGYFDRMYSANEDGSIDTDKNWFQTKVLQRYSLATLYYATNGMKSWFSIGNWLSDVDVCLWYGIICNDDALNEQFVTVTGINLNYNGLNGTIPNEIGLLEKSLSILWIEATIFDLDIVLPSSTNPRLVGTIPTTIGLLTKLEHLVLGKNDLTGTIPTEIQQLGNALEVFQFDGNHNLIGNVNPIFCDDDTSNINDIQFPLLLTLESSSDSCNGQDGGEEGDTTPIVCNCCTNCV